MGLRILYHNDLLLREISQIVPRGFDVQGLVEKLKDSIRYEDKVWTSCGLSLCGVQIGLPFRVILIGRPLYWGQGKHHQAFDVIVNPEIVKTSEEVKEEWEGCLSIPDLECLVSRYQKVTLEYLNLSGKSLKRTFENTVARVIQHEIDHLDGVLMTDKAKSQRKKLSHNT